MALIVDTVGTPASAPTNASGWTTCGRSVADPGEAWATLRDGANTYGALNRSGGPLIDTGTTIGNIKSNSAINIGINLTDYDLVTFTGATLEWECENSVTSTTLFATDAANGIALVGQRESVRGQNLNVTDYTEIMNAAVAGTEYATRIPWSGLPGAGGGTETWTFNANGVAYLNSVHNKAYNAGYAYLGLCWGGIVDGLTPLSDGVNRTQRVDPKDNNNDMTLTLTYTHSAQPVQINIGDYLRVATGAKINISNAWKEVVEIKINIGDAWKDVIV